MSSFLGWHDNNQSISSRAGVAIKNVPRERGEGRGQVALDGNQPVVSHPMIFNERYLFSHIQMAAKKPLAKRARSQRGPRVTSQFPQPVNLETALAVKRSLIDDLKILEGLRISSHQAINGVAIAANYPFHPLLRLRLHSRPVLAI